MLTHNMLSRMNWLKDELGEYSPGGTRGFKIIEPSTDGYAEVDCLVSSETILFHKLDKNGCSYLRNSKCADAILFERTSDQHWRLLILECTKTIKESTWTDKIKLQFEGALLNAQTLLGLLGIDKVVEIRCYTAFRNDRISAASNPNPVLLKDRALIYFCIPHGV